MLREQRKISRPSLSNSSLTSSSYGSPATESFLTMGSSPAMASSLTNCNYLFPSFTLLLFYSFTLLLFYSFTLSLFYSLTKCFTLPRVMRHLARIPDGPKEGVPCLGSLESLDGALRLLADADEFYKSKPAR